jgi:ATP-dependent protease ClpP protease subunit
MLNYSEFSPHLINVLTDVKIGELRLRLVRIYKNPTGPDSRRAMPFECSTNDWDNYREHIELDGEINKDSSLVIERMLKRVKKCKDINTGELYETVVYLNSRGGFLSDGYKIGKVFKKYGVQAVVEDGQKCSSACATAFLGAKYRIVSPNGSLLFHAPYVDLKDKGIKCSIRSKEKQLNNYYVNMLGEENGDILFDRTMDYCDNNTGWTINSGAAYIFGISTKESQEYVRVGR